VDSAAPAATVVVLRDGPTGLEALMVQRRAGAFGGAHVFPGGRVDPGDRQPVDAAWCAVPDVTTLQGGGTDATAFYVAAARELFEEVGILLARDSTGGGDFTAGDWVARVARYRRAVHSGALTLREVAGREHLRIALDELVPFAHWVTPAIEPRRFDTQFFLTSMPPGQHALHDTAETSSSRWVAPSAALDEGAAGQIALAPPTWTTLRELEPLRTVAQALGWARGRRISRREPNVLIEDGSPVLLMPGDPMHPDPDADFVASETRFRWTGERWVPSAAPKPAR
jgi:8-oxo-dGTP pyrophosphatase MutT (NUDIX family)